MAKVPAKKTATATKAVSEKPAAKKAPAKTKSATAMSIDAACIAAAEKLSALGLDAQLQAEIDWCLASYRNDGNPVGLYQMIERALPIFKEELGKKTKGITAKFIADLEKAGTN
jgi:hypothetical protein